MSDSIKIDRKLAEELEDKLSDLTHRWSPSDTMADYECVFCGNRPSTNKTSIIHEDNCLGVRLAQTLWLRMLD